jgi:hypothetical protein
MPCKSYSGRIDMEKLQALWSDIKLLAKRVIAKLGL